MANDGLLWKWAVHIHPRFRTPSKSTAITVLGDAIFRSLCPIFFFSSRRRHTRYWRDWSSDVCSSDLLPQGRVGHAGFSARADFLPQRGVGERTFQAGTLARVNIRVGQSNLSALGYRRTHFGPVHAQPGFLTVGDPDGRVSPIGFASVNIPDASTPRASRATPAVTTAQAALSDAMAARDRECKGGVGKFCRERETAVTERRQAVDLAMHGVQEASDPQTTAMIRVVAWASLGTLRPTEND